MLPPTLFALHCDSTMSSPLLVKISRDGKELGTYEAKEALRLLINGTLEGTDFYWHDGMTEWAPLLNLVSSETFKQLAQKAEAVAKAKAELKERAKRKANEDAISATAKAATTFGVKRSVSGRHDNLAEVGGWLFAVGVVAVPGAYFARNNAQSESDKYWEGMSHRGPYPKIDSSGYETFAFVAGAVALLGLGLIIAGLVRSK